MLGIRSIGRLRGSSGLVHSYADLIARAMCTTSSSPKTAVLMLNMGGPQGQDDVHSFLNNIFADRQLIRLPMQKLLGPFIALRRTPKVKASYNTIGGGSPIFKLSSEQARAMEDRLDAQRPESAPHKAYIGFRYAKPLTDSAVSDMVADGVKRLVVFSQYPQWSCSTSGSSYLDLWRILREQGLDKRFEISVIDRWYEHPLFIEALSQRVQEGLEQFEDGGKDAVVLYSAHSLPMRRVNSGDPYPQEVAATVQKIVENLRSKGVENPYTLAYQSQVGPLPWLGATTEFAIEGFSKRGYKKVLVVPVAFTTDHIETLVEIDQEFAEVAEKHGIDMKRSPSLNDSPVFADALSAIVASHLDSGEVCSSQYPLRCPGCINEDCRNIVAPIKAYQRKCE